jgi:hypothetical protein
MSVFVFPMKIFRPFQNGSVLDCLMVTCMIEGSTGLSTAMSVRQR